jgi:hypothetical protein
VVYAATLADEIGVLVLALGAAAVVYLGVGLARAMPASVLPAVAGVMAAWTAAAWSHGAEAPRGTALAAAGVFAASELSFWSIEQPVVPDEPELAARRLGGLAVRAAAAFALATLILAALGLQAGSGLLLETVGVAATVGLVTLVFALARADSPER